MTVDEFWAIVESVGWGSVDTDYKRGKQVLLQALPTLEAKDNYDSHMSHALGALNKAIEGWERSECKELPVGDDSFGDLKAHIVGLGREEWEKVCADPSLAYKRACDYAYTESFSYCTPYREDYDPTETKLGRAVSALEHWQNRLDETPDAPEWMAREVETRTAEVNALREQLAAEGGTELSVEEYEAQAEAKRQREAEKWDALRRFDRDSEEKLNAALAKTKREFQAERAEARKALVDSYNNG